MSKLTAAMPELEFQQKILDGVEAQAGEAQRFRSDIQKVTDDLGRADREVKTALEELTKVKNATNVTFEEVMKKYDRLQKQIALNAHSSFRNPIERALTTNEELRFNLNAMARYIIAVKANSLGALDPAFRKAVDDANAKTRALTGVDASLGQATVPQETFNEIYDLLLEYGDYSTLGVMRVGMRTTVLPVATARPQFYWIGSQAGVAEGSTITSGAFAGSQVLLIIQTLAVLMYIARELLQDSTVDLAPYVIRQMIESVNWGMDTAAFLGTGNADQTNAGYVGIFNAALANTNMASVAAAGHTTVGTTTLEDWVQTILTVSPEVLNRKPMWWLHSQQLARVALIRDKNGRPLFQTWLEVPNPKSVGSILGYPIHPTAIAPSTDGANAVVAAFGDPEGQCVGIRTDLGLATSEDIGFPQNLMAYRTLIRAGVKMKTLANSTTLVPFAVLSTAPA
jgi:HK97 family phage major capsid protein